MHQKTCVWQELTNFVRNHAKRRPRVKGVTTATKEIPPTQPVEEFDEDEDLGF